MPPVIKLESLGSGSPVEIIRVDGGNLTLGREPENSIVVDSDSVSRRHGCLSSTDTQWVFRDLHSTNGSWVNGVKIQPSQIRLLRDGDVVQLADFPVKVSSVVPDDGESPALQEPILLVFLGEKFQAEHSLGLDGSIFSVGGEGGDVFVDGADNSVGQIQIMHTAGRLELTTGANTVPVIVNGVAASGGVTALSDRDEVDVGPYKIVVCDNRFAATDRQNVAGAGTSPTAISPAQAYDRPRVPEHLRKKKEADGWESEAARRRSTSGRKFVFGTPPEGQDPFGTMSLRQHQFHAKAGFDLSASQRFAVQPDLEEDGDEPAITEKVQIIIGAIIFAILLGAMIFYLGNI